MAKDANKDDEDLLQKIERKHAHNDSLFVSTRENYCFAILEQNEKRVYQILSLFDAVNQITSEIKNGQKEIERIIRKYFEVMYKDSHMVFTLSHNEIVYLPNFEEAKVPLLKSDPDFNEYWQNRKKICKRLFYVKKFSGNLCYFTPVNMAEEIKFSPAQKDSERNNLNEEKNKTIVLFEFGSYKDCSPYVSQEINGELKQIKIQEYCFKVKIDRLGYIEPVYGFNKT